MFAFLEDLILRAATAWWTPLALFILCFIDGFFPIVPSESLIVALAAIADRENTVGLTTLFFVGWFGATLGDQVAFRLGRAIGVTRFRWMRSRRVAGIVQLARRSLHRNGALLIITARHVPGGRVAVNFVAGATGYAWWKFSLLDFVSAGVWAGYSIAIGVLTTGWLDNVLLQIVVALIFAGLLGLLIDFVARKVVARISSTPAQAPAEVIRPAGFSEDSSENGHGSNVRGRSGINSQE